MVPGVVGGELTVTVTGIISKQSIKLSPFI
jgi:hypothetical protein